MDSIRSLLDESTLQSIARSAGQGVTEQQVEDVLNAVLPAIEKDTASGTLATRAAQAQQQTVTRGGTRAGGMDLLSMLLGGNASAATQSAASSANVSSGQASSILKIAAPILLYLLLSKTGSSNQNSGGLLGSLLGGGSSNSSGGGLLGSLLGGGSSQQSGGGGLLRFRSLSLLGGSLFGGLLLFLRFRRGLRGLCFLFLFQRLVPPYENAPYLLWLKAVYHKGW